MKRLFITLEYPPQTGGIASFVYNLMAHLPAEDNILWAPKMTGGGEFDSSHAMRVFRGRPYWSFIWPHWLRLLFSIWWLCRKEKIQKIYLHHVLPVGYVCYLLKKIKHIPYVVFFHGTDLELASRHNRNKLVMVCREAEEIIVHSEFMRQKATTILGPEISKKFKTIYPSPGDIFLQDVIKEKVESIKNQLGLSGKKVIISVGRMEDGKGFTRLVALLPQLVKQIPNVVCLLIGRGPKRDWLIQSVERGNLQNSVRFLGEVEYSDLPAYYHAADIFVLLSHQDQTREESWGTVFLEAAACGLATVAGRAGGVPETVENGITGWVVDSNNKQETLDTIIKLLNDQKSAKIMGAAGRERVLRDFIWDKQILKLW
ncbi:MAG: glycosyltransferase family 4 protein [bacterium]|nr:glycosyltransferase family 4 protein [bacterium]